jgi:hypothetical protein
MAGYLAATSDCSSELNRLIAHRRREGKRKQLIVAITELVGAKWKHGLSWLSLKWRSDVIR